MGAGGSEPLVACKDLLAWKAKDGSGQGEWLRRYLENSVHFLAGTARQYVFVCCTMCGKHL